ncbi:hypothetical protein ABE493_11665 [Stenotrophomonas terrae]|uniref:hypothetical protein n=1 Tax=Stenotrophomonas terrae TaxID=405446 RepID=UPI00320ADF89
MHAVFGSLRSQLCDDQARAGTQLVRRTQAHAETPEPNWWTAVIPRMNMDSSNIADRSNADTSLTGPGSYPLDLTGPSSHTLMRTLGAGSLVIAAPGSAGKSDLQVAPDQKINWAAFAPFATPAGSPWPRVIHYAGSDLGIFEWARQRPIEQLTWTPVLHTDTLVDASRSNIRTLAIQLDLPGANLQLLMPAQEIAANLHLSISGDIGRFSAQGQLPRSLSLAPETGSRRETSAFQLPDMGELHEVHELMLVNKPMGRPISLKCLSRFTQLQSLSLYGNFVDLEALAEQPQLQNLQLRYMPSLEGLPVLSCWPALDGFIAFNIEEAAGKRLRQQLKARTPQRPWTKHASVSQLRKESWWESEFGRPFSAWSKRLAKQANEAFDGALAALASSHSLADAEAAFSEFARRFNALKGIETTERDDLGEAIWQLSSSEHAVRIGVTEELAQQWFDAVRDY